MNRSLLLASFILLGTSKNLAPAASALRTALWQASDTYRSSFGYPALLLSQLPAGSFLRLRLGWPNDDRFCLPICIGTFEVLRGSLKEIIHRDDGGAVLLAEQYYWYWTTSTMSTGNGGSTTVTTIHYIHNDLLVINIDPQGNIEWAAKVPKRQHSANRDLFSGFTSAVKGDNIYLVFNDSGENLFLKPGDKVKQFELTGKDALVVLATVDGDGNETREALFSPERRDVILRPMDCVQLKDGPLFIYASRNKDYRFGNVEFK